MSGCTIEPLEARRLLAGLVLHPDGSLVIQGDWGRRNDITLVGTADPLVMNLYLNQAPVIPLYLHNVARIVVRGGNGNDRLSVDEHDGVIGRSMRLNGWFGDDLLVASVSGVEMFGGPGNDRIYGGSGADIILGEGGHDDLFGGGGDDYIRGGGGSDWIDGGPGNDALFGDDGRDYLFGGPGADYLDGGGGDDVLVDRSLWYGFNTFRGGRGFDTFFIGYDDDITDYEYGEPVYHFPPGGCGCEEWWYAGV